jgi:hypothetical protein
VTDPALEIEEWVARFRAAHPGLTPEQTAALLEWQAARLRGEQVRAKNVERARGRA